MSIESKNNHEEKCWRKPKAYSKQVQTAKVHKLNTEISLGIATKIKNTKWKIQQDRKVNKHHSCIPVHHIAF